MSSLNSLATNLSQVKQYLLIKVALQEFASFLQLNTKLVTNMHRKIGEKKLHNISHVFFFKLFNSSLKILTTPFNSGN